VGTEALTFRTPEGQSFYAHRVHDAEGNRTLRYVWTDADADGQIDQETRFVYDGQQIVLQFDGDCPDFAEQNGTVPFTTDENGAPQLTLANLTHRYLWGSAVDQLLADEQLSPLPPGEGQGEGDQGEGGENQAVILTEPGNVVWALSDQLGTVRDLAVLDAATVVTSVANHRAYNSFGQLTSETNAAIDCLFGFTGRALDPTTGLQNNLNRWYDPALGEWITNDPLGLKAGDANTGRYCGNGPTNATDPSGMVPVGPPPLGGENGWFGPEMYAIERLRSQGRNLEAAKIAAGMFQTIATSAHLRGMQPAADMLQYWLDKAPDGDTYTLKADDVKGAIDAAIREDNFTFRVSTKGKVNWDIIQGKTSGNLTSKFHVEVTYGPYCYALGGFSIEFSGTWNSTKGQISFSGTWTVSDIYTFRNNGKSVHILGTEIPDWVGNLVQNQNLAKSFSVNGTWSGTITLPAEVSPHIPSPPNARDRG